MDFENNVDALFLFCIVMSLASFVAFIMQVWKKTIEDRELKKQLDNLAKKVVEIEGKLPPQSSAPEGAAASAQQYSGAAIGNTIQKSGEAAESFGRAGPIATTALMVVFFTMVALLATGVETLQLETGD